MRNDGWFDWKFLLRFVVVFLLYLVTAWFGLRFDAVGGFATLIWPPAGIALAAVFLGYEYLLSVFLAAFIINFFYGAPVAVGFMIAFGNTLSAFVGGYLLKNVFSFNLGFQRLKDGISLVLIASIIPLISSSLGSFSLYLGGVIERSLLETILMTWWLGDALGILILGSLIFVWGSQDSINWRSIKFSVVLESVFFYTVLLVICLASFGGFFGIDSRRLPITQLLYPTLIWFCLRLNPQLSITGVFFVALLSVWGTSNKVGPFVRESLEESLLFLLVFVASIAVTFIILASVMAERKKLHSLKDEFISAASHELRTPVTTIKAYVQLISKQIKNKETVNLDLVSVSTYMSRVEEQLERLVKLIHNLLDVSRIESGKVELEYSTFTVDELIHEMVKDFARTTKSHSIIYKGGAKYSIEADRYRISQVLINLISNAIKFSTEGKRIIIQVTQKGKWVIFSVRDFGIGIDPKYQTEIFERFFQTEHRKLNTSAGLGLGLYLSSEIVKKHGGRVWVKSQLGQGSSFYFSLPIEK